MRKSLYSMVGFVLLSVFVLSGSVSCTYSEPPSTLVFVVLDTSGSWIPIHKDRNVVSRVNDAILESASYVQKPVHYYLLKITSDSLREKPVCSITHEKESIFKPGYSKKAFAAELGLCKRITQKLDATKYTDITGALDLTSRMSSNHTLGRKYLIIISDMKEEQPDGRITKTIESCTSQLAHLKLSGFKAAIIYNILPNKQDRDDSDFPGIWKKCLGSTGIADVTLIHESTNLVDEITRVFMQGDDAIAGVKNQGD